MLPPFASLCRLVDDIRDRADVTRVFKLLLKYQSCQEEDDEPAVVAVTVAGDGAVDGSAAPAGVGGLSSTAVLKGASTKGHAAPRGDALTAATVLHFMKEIQREEDATIEDALRCVRTGEGFNVVQSWSRGFPMCAHFSLSSLRASASLHIFSWMAQPWLRRRSPRSCCPGSLRISPPPPTLHSLPSSQSATKTCRSR